MGAQGAAPEGLLAGTSDGRQINGGSAGSLPPQLGEVILGRLAGHDIATLEQWRSLGRRRYRLFGLTRRMVAQIDAAAREACA